MTADLAICANRGCSNRVSAVHFTKCPPCLLGLKKLEKRSDQVLAVEALPPLAHAGPDAFAFRVPGRPLSWNNALIRPRHGRPFLSEAAREWKRVVGIYALKARPRGWRLDGQYQVEIRSWFERSSSDVDGPVKLVLDALKGVAYNDDKQVVHSPPWKQVDPRAPRLEVTVRAILDHPH